MDAFRFRLQRALAWYQQRCRIEEDRLRLIREDMTRVDDEKARTELARETTARDLTQSSSVRAGDLAALAGFIQGSRRQVLVLDQKRRELGGILRDQQGRVNGLRTKVRLLEKLRDRRLSEYSVMEQKELEELAADAFRAATFRQGLQCAEAEPSQR